ncbi:FecR family protein [Sphingomonas sp. GlSt437]|uniref:FecR family protein n=1 Tax=Sphingomonas sp. GlSt437 TaxID=3389970 RepID=UPI003A8C2C1B
MTGTQQHGEDTAEAEAAEWFARLKSLPVSRTTLQQFFDWRREDRHAEAFAAVERVWEQAGDLADRPAIRAATEAAVDRAPRQRWFASPFKPAVAALAAVLLVLLGSGITYWLVQPASNAYATRVGEQSMIALEDGSKMTLDTDTRVVVSFDRDQRRVVLTRGQAFFTVAHDSVRPFRVTAGDAQVQATGTQFGVRRDGGAVDVTLVEGSVRVATPTAQPTILAAGQQLALGADKTLVVHKIDTAAATAWKSGRIVLDRWTLGRALGEVNRYTTHPVELDAPQFADARLSGTFDVGDIDSFVAATTAVLPLDAVRDPDGAVRLVDRAAARKDSSTS